MEIMEIMIVILGAALGLLIKEVFSAKGEKGFKVFVIFFAIVCLFFCITLGSVPNIIAEVIGFNSAGYDGVGWEDQHHIVPSDEKPNTISIQQVHSWSPIPIVQFVDQNQSGKPLLLFGEGVINMKSFVLGGKGYKTMKTKLKKIGFQVVE